MALCRVCDEQFSDRRAALGYSVCLDCSATVSPPVRTVVPLNKSNYMLITNRVELKQLNPKRFEL